MIQPDSTAFSYVNYSGSDSSEAEDGTSHQERSFLLPPTRPSSMYPPRMQPPAPPPTKALPAAPKPSKQRSSNTTTADRLQPQRGSSQVEGHGPAKTLAEDDD
jgi:hypothetical protein